MQAPTQRVAAVKTFYLIDGHAQIFRAYYAPYGQLSSPSGEPTKATYTFLQMVLAILRERKPEYLAVALDHDDATTVRRQFYPEYKANRDATPEDLGPQVKRITQLLEELEVPVFQVRGQEADDVIASLARQLEGEDIELIIVSRDKDLHQLLGDRVKLWDPHKDQIIDPATLMEELGYRPDQAVEIQTLTGDSTDNVPGIPGIGPKRAALLIQKYGTAEAVLDHADELSPKLRENLLAHGETLDLSRRLVTLNRDVDLDFDLERCRVKPVDVERLRPILGELGFHRTLDYLEGQAGRTTVIESRAPAPPLSKPGVEVKYRNVTEDRELAEFVALLGRQKRFAIDTETTSLQPIDGELVGLSFSWKAGEGWYLPVRSSREKVLDPGATLRALKPILEDPSIEKCGQNIKFDRVVLLASGIDLRGVTFDSMIASYLLYPGRRNHGMDSLARDLLGYETVPISELIGKGRKQISMLEVDLDALTRYAAEDADITWRLCEELAPKLVESTVASLFHDVEIPLATVLADMEYRGVALDCERLRAIHRELGARLDELTGQIHDAAGHEFTIDSPKQLAEILFDEQGLPVIKKTKTSRSTDASVLQALSVQTAHPLPALVLEYRELSKLRGTYVGPLPGLVSPRTGRLHASFHQAVTTTGRLSSSNPNLQNIPVRTEQGREIRKAFVPGDRGHVLLTADYSQIELRVLAHFSRDPALVEAFQNNQDIHTAVAAQLAGVSQESVTREQRTQAKAVNFGIIYGQGAFGLSRLLGIGQREAADFIKRYKERYGGIVRFIDDCIAQAKQKGEVQTMLGRRRPIPEISSRNRARRAQGERLAVNTVVQGSAADLIKVAMVRIHRRIRDEELDLRLLVQVHDELVLEARKDRVEEYAAMVCEEMASALPLDVPVQVDTAWGDNWLEGKQ